MAANLTAQVDSRHLLRSDTRGPMAKAGLPDVRKADEDTWKAQIGGAIKEVRGSLSLKEFADRIDRDDRQVARWEDGKERPQLDAIFAVADFQGPLVIALARLTTMVSVETTITVRRRA